MFSLSFRNYTTGNMWIHSFVHPKYLPSCNATDVFSGTLCAGDGKTLIEVLLTLDSLPYVSVNTNSTTGRICPSSSDVDAKGNALIFSTNITFSSVTVPGQSITAPAVSTTTGHTKISSGSMGDVPPLFINTALAPASTTLMSAAETIKGSADSVSEVQVFTVASIRNSTSPPFQPFQASALLSINENVETHPHGFLGTSLPSGFFSLKYNLSKALLPTDASATEFASVVSKLMDPDSSSMLVNVTRSTMTTSSFSSVTWTVTFPSNYGRASLLQAVTSCVGKRSGSLWPNEPSAYSIYTPNPTPLSMPTEYMPPANLVDTWRGSSCLLTFPNVIYSRRIVTGTVPLYGSVGLLLNDGNRAFSVYVPISTITTNLQPALNKIVGLEKATVSTVPYPANPRTTLLVIDFVNRLQASLALDTSGLTLGSGTKWCAQPRRRQSYDGTDKKTGIGSAQTGYLGTLSTETPCYFPFLYNGMEYSTCANAVNFGEGQSFCSATYNLDLDQKWGKCEPCSYVTANGLPATSMVLVHPLTKTARWIGNLDQLSGILSNMIYVPIPDVVSSVVTSVPSALSQPNAVSPLGPSSPPVITDYVSVFVQDNQAKKRMLSPASMEFPVMVSVPNDAPKISLNYPRAFHFEDKLAYLVNAISISDSNYPSLTSQTQGMVGVTLTVTQGDIFVTSYEGISFARENVTGRLTFSGPLRNVNSALSSLIYQPSPDWNSALNDNVNASVRSTQRVVISVDPRIESQSISTSIQGPGGGSIIIPPNVVNSYFQLRLNCSQYAAAVNAINKHSPEVMAASFVTDMLAGDERASSMQFQITQMFSLCENLLTFAQPNIPNVNQAPLNSTSFIQTVQLGVTVLVTRSEYETTRGQNTFTWDVTFLLPYSTTDSFPLLTVATNNLKSSKNAATVSINVIRTGSNFPMGSFKLGYSGEWTSPLQVGASAQSVADALNSLDCINSVTVSSSVIEDQFKLRTGYIYDFTFDHSISWTPNIFNESVNGMIGHEPAFGPMDKPLSVDASNLSGYGLDVSSLVTNVGGTGLVPVTLGITVTDFGLISSFGSPIHASHANVVSANMSLYVIPTIDLPRVEFPISLANVTTTEDTAAPINGISLINVDKSLTDDPTLYSLVISSPFASIQLGSDFSASALNVTVQNTSSESSYTPSLLANTPTIVIKHLTINGTVDSISRAISQLYYVPDNYFCGISEIVFVITSSSSLYSGIYYRQTLPVSITCIDNAPFIQVSGNYSTVLATIPTPLASVSINDPDSTGNIFVAGDRIDNNRGTTLDIMNSKTGGGRAGGVLVTLKTSNGGILQVPTLVEFSPGEYMPTSWQSGPILTISGYQGTVNTVLKFLRYVGSANGTVDDTVFISLVTPSGSANASLAVRIVPLSSSDSIQINVPTDIPHLMEDVVSLLSGVSVSSNKTKTGNDNENEDEDDGISSCDIIITCETGTLSVVNSTLPFDTLNITIVSSGPVLHIQTDSLLHLNQALSSMYFVPFSNFNGPVELTVSVMAELQSGLAPVSTSAVFYVIVDAVDDPPTISLRPDVGKRLIGSSASIDSPTLLRAFDVVDVDDIQPLLVTITCQVGTLSMSGAFGNPGISFTAADSYQLASFSDSSLTFFADKANVTAVLDYVVYRPADYYKGRDTVVLNVSSITVPRGTIADSSSTFQYGIGASASASITLVVTMPSVMRFLTPRSVIIQEDETLNLGQIANLDVFTSTSSLGSSSLPLGSFVILSISCDAGTLGMAYAPSSLASQFEVLEDSFTMGYNAFASTVRTIGSVGLDGSSSAGLFGNGNGSSITAKLSAGITAKEFMSLLTFYPASDMNGNVTFTLSASLEDISSVTSTPGGSPVTTTSKMVPLVILPVNDPPVIRVNGTAQITPTQASVTTLQVMQDTLIPLTFISISDVDVKDTEYGYLEFTCVAMLGSCMLTRSQTTGTRVLPVDPGDNPNSLRLLGNDVDLTAFLTSGFVAYVPPPDVSPLEGMLELMDNVTITVNDNGFFGLPSSRGNSSSVTLSVQITPVVKYPSLIVSSGALLGEEDHTVSVDGNVHIDVGSFTHETVVKLSISSHFGVVALLQDTNEITEGIVEVAGSAVNVTQSTRDSFFQMTVTGPISCLNTLLESFAFKPFDNVAMTCNVTFSLSYASSSSSSSPLPTATMDSIISDGGAALTTSPPKFLLFYLMPRNDPPEIVILRQQTPAIHVPQGSSLDFGSPLLWYITDSDIMEGPPRDNMGKLTATIKTNCGALAMEASSELWILTHSSTTSQLSISTKDAVYDLKEACGGVSNPSPLFTQMNIAPIGYSSITFEGSLDAVNAAIASLRYIAPSAFSGDTLIQLDVSDNGNFGVKASSSSKTDTGNKLLVTEMEVGKASAVFAITVDPVNEIPAITLNPSVSILEHSTLVGSTIIKVIDDPDSTPNEIHSSRMTVSLNIMNSSAYTAYISIPQSFEYLIIDPSTSSLGPALQAPLQPYPNGNNASTILLAGSLADINAAVQQAAIELPYYYHGAITLSMTTTDGFGASSSLDVAIPVHAVSDASSLRFINDSTSLETGVDLIEDEPAAFPFTVIDEDINFLSQSGSSLCVFDPNYCSLTVSVNCNQCLFSSRSQGPSLADGFSITASLTSINNMLGSVSILGVNDFNGLANMTVSITKSATIATEGQKTSTFFIPVSIAAVNDAPRVRFPAAYFIVEEKEVKLLFDGGKPTEILDVDVVNPTVDRYRVKLSCFHCTLHVYPSAAGVASNIEFSGNVSRGATVTMYGLLDDVNKSLLDVLYVPETFYSGRDIITVSATDALGAIGTSSLPVFVKEINNPPVIRLPNPYPASSVLEGQVLTLTNISVTDGDLNVFDIRSSYQLQATVNAAHGGVLEIQEVTAFTKHVNELQVIRIAAINPALNISGGSFALSVDLTMYNLSIYNTSDISFNAVDMEWSEVAGSTKMGSRIGQSIQAKLEAIPGFAQLGITVYVRKHVSPRTSKVGGPARSTKWLVYFHNVDYRFPVIKVAYNRLHTASPLNSDYNATYVSVYRATPLNTLGGTFALSLGGSVTPQIPFNASPDQFAQAIEALPDINAVGVTRSGPTLDLGYTWTVTFFATASFENGDIPELIPVTANLTGITIRNDPEGYLPSLLRPNVSVVTTQQGRGRLKVTSVVTQAYHVNETISIKFYTYNPFEENFFVNVYDSTSGKTEAVGPIYMNTVAMSQDEVVGPYPPYSQPEGTKSSNIYQDVPIGQSIQSMFRALSFFDDYAEDVHVETIKIAVYNNASNPNRKLNKVQWVVTFINAKPTNFVYTITSQASVTGPAVGETQLNYNITSRAMVQTNIPPNLLGGSFQLSCAGYATVGLNFDITSDMLTRELMRLPSIHDSRTGVGKVMTTRRGPSLEGAYMWYIAILQSNPEYGVDSDIVPVKNGTAMLTGIGASIETKVLRNGLSGYGLKLNRGVGGVTGVSGLSTFTSASASASISASRSLSFEWQPTVTFQGSPATLSSVLSSMLYKPAPNWEGDAVIIIRVVDLTLQNKITQASSPAYPEIPNIYGIMEVPITDTFAVINVTVVAVNSAPIILWRNQDITKNVSAAVVRVYEDTDVVLGTQFLLDDGDQFIKNDPSQATHIGSQIYTDLHERASTYLFTHELGVQVYDADVGGGTLTVTLSVQRGTLSVNRDDVNVGIYTPSTLDPSRLRNVSFNAGATHSHGLLVTSPNDTITIQGGLIEVNNILRTLKYQTAPNDIGYDYINITVWDNGNTGSTFVNQSTSSILTVKIIPKNDAPVISIFGTQLGLLYDNDSVWSSGLIVSNEDETVPLGNYFNISDVDMNLLTLSTEYKPDLSWYRDQDIFEWVGMDADMIYVSLQCKHGVITIPSPLGVQMLHNASATPAPPDVPLSPEMYAYDVNMNADYVKPAMKKPRYRDVFIKGHFHQVQSALASATYTPDENWFGVDVVVIYINDLGNIGVDGPKDLTRKIIMDVKSVDDAPKITAPGKMLSVVEDMVGVIGSDCCDWVTESYGDSIMNMSTMSIQISDRDVLLVPRMKRVVTRNATYTNIMTNDPLLNLANKTYTLNGIRMPGGRANQSYGTPGHASYGAPEGQDLHFLIVDDHDHSAYSSSSSSRPSGFILDNFTVALNVSHGTMTMPRVSDDLVFLHGSGFQDDDIIVRGSLIDINNALRGLQYTPDLNWNSLHSEIRGAYQGVENIDTLHVLVTGPNGLKSAETVEIYVKPANDPPVISLGTLNLHDSIRDEFDQVSRKVIKIKPLVCQENAKCPMEDVHVRDVDAIETSGGAILFTISASHGTFSMDPAASAMAYYFSASAALGAGYVQITIPADQMNIALRGLIFTPNMDYYGEDSIVISVDDLGNSGYGPLCPTNLESMKLPCRLTDAMALPVIIEGKPDRIEIHTPSTVLTVLEDQTVVIPDFYFTSHQRLERFDPNSITYSTVYKPVNISYTVTARPNRTSISTLPRGAIYNGTITVYEIHNVSQTTSTNMYRWNVPTGSNNGTYSKIPQYKLENMTYFADGKIFQLDMSTAFGSLSLSYNATPGITYLTGSQIEGSHIMLRGQLPLLNMVVQNMTFIPSPNLNILNAGLASITVVITDVLATPFNVTDDGSAEAITAAALEKGDMPPDASTRAEILIRVAPVNDAPILTVPGQIYAVNAKSKTKEPVVVSVNTVYLEEGEEHSLAGVSIFDVDDDETPASSSMVITLTSQNGFFFTHNYTVFHEIEPMALTRNGARLPSFQDLSMGVLDGASREVLQTEMDSLVAYGTVQLQGKRWELNSFLVSMAYRPNKYYNGPDDISITICDSCQVGEAAFSTINNPKGSVIMTGFADDSATCSLCDTRSVPVIVTPVNNPPRWYLPRTTVSLQEDSPFVFTGSVFLEDVDSGFGGDLFVALKVNFGYLSFPFAPLGITFIVGTGEQDTEIHVMGSLANLNSALSQLQYTPPRNWNSIKSGSLVTISVYVDDNGNSASFKSLDVPPVLGASPAPTYSAQDSLNRFTWSPSPKPTPRPTSALPSFSPTARPTPEVGAPTLIPSPQPSASPTLRPNAPSPKPTPRPSSEPTMMPSAMPISFAPTPYDNVPPPKQYDSHQGLTDAGTITLVVLPGVNHAPFIRLPGAQYREYPCESQDGQLGETQDFKPSVVFVQCNRTISVDMFYVQEDTPTVIPDIVIGDVDEVDNIFGTKAIMLVNASAVHGLISLPNFIASGVQVIEGKSTGDPSISFIGTLANLNNALKLLTYTPPLNYFGPETISIYVNDSAYGNSQSGKSTNETIPVYVNAVVDPPIMIAPDQIYDTIEDKFMVITGVSVEDPDFIEDALGTPTWLRNNGQDGLYPFKTSNYANDSVNAQKYPYVPPGYGNATVNNTFWKPYSPYFQWNKIYREQSVGMLRVTISSLHGMVKLANSNGLTYLSIPSVTDETERLSDYPIVDKVPLETREMFHGVDSSVNAESGPPIQQWWKSVTVEGRLADINRALLYIIYKPDNNWNSDTDNFVSSLQPMAYDNVSSSSSSSNSAGGPVNASASTRVGVRKANPQQSAGQDKGRLADGPRSSNFDVINMTVWLPSDLSIPPSTKLSRVRVHAVNDAPVISLQGAQYRATQITEDMLSAVIMDSQTLFTVEDTALEVNGTSVRDVDLRDDGFVRVSLTALHGTVTITAPIFVFSKMTDTSIGGMGLYFNEGTGTNDTHMVFTAPIRIVNQALSQITFWPTLNYFGAGARLTITVDDLGNVGYGGAKSDTQTLRIAVTPVNDPPSIGIPLDFKENPIFILDEGTYLRIDGATFRPEFNYFGEGVDPTSPASMPSQAPTMMPLSYHKDPTRIKLPVDVNDPATRSWQSGFEVWRLTEESSWSNQKTSSTSMGTYGAAQLNWYTRQVADINPGIDSSFPRFYTPYNGFLYYAVDDGVSGVELWRDAGVLENTALLQSPIVGGGDASMFLDLVPGKAGSNPKYLQVFNGYLYFSAEGSDLSWMVDPAHEDKCHSFRQSTFDPRVRYAVSEVNVWTPSLVYDCPPGFHWATTAEGYELFTNYMDETVERFWHSEGAAESRVPPQQYNYLGMFEQSTSIERDSSHETKVYFEQCGWDEYTWGSKTRVHFRFRDSYKTGAYKHAGKPDSYRPDLDPFGTKTGGLWTDSFAGIVCVAGDGLSGIGDVNVRDLRSAGDGAELWRTDGTSRGTHRLEDLYPGHQGSDPAYLTPMEGRLFFAASTEDQGRELWYTLGGPAQAKMISVFGSDYFGIYPGFESSDPAYLTAAMISPLAGSYLFFAATNDQLGRELWLLKYTAGTPGDGYLSNVDIVPGSDSSNPHGFTSSGGALPVYFAAYTPATGIELWVSDGTTAGTVLMADIQTGTASSNPKYLTWFKGSLYFQADDGEYGIELWKASGGIGGTVTLLNDIRAGVYDSGPAYFASMKSLLDGQDYLYFTATDGYMVSGQHSLEGYGGCQLWVTDGTSAGTRRAFQKTDNDFYIDRISMDTTYPPAMSTFNNGLYLSASYGLHDLQIPRGGSRIYNQALLYGISQAVVITDVDTPNAGNISVSLNVNQGLLVLSSVMSRPPESRKPFNILLAEHRETDRSLIRQALESLGHIVDTVMDGESAYNAYIARAQKATTTPHVIEMTPELIQEYRLYDCILISVQFQDPSGNGWDGLQTTREIRDWERGRGGGEGGGEGGGGSDPHVPIFGLTVKRDLVNDKAECASAGMDDLLDLFEVNYVDDPAARIQLDSVSRTTSADIVMLEAEVALYSSMASLVDKLLTKESNSVNITAVFDNKAHIPTMTERDMLPGLTVGSTVYIEGTLAQVNNVLRDVFFYAPNDTSGQVSLTITATDDPLPCLKDVAMLASTDNKTASFSSPGLSVLPTSYFNATFTNNTRTGMLMCDGGNHNTAVRVIDILVQGVNQPPSIYIEQQNPMMQSALDALTPMPMVSISDIDHQPVGTPVLLSSFGFEIQPPISVLITCNMGRVTLMKKDGLSFVQGKGEQDRVCSIRAPIDVVNTALSTLQYMCTSIDKCQQGHVDVCTIEVDDEGFSGKGGAMQASGTISILVV